MFGFLKRLFGRAATDGGKKPQDEAAAPSVEDELRALLRRDLRSGFVPVGEAITSALEVLEEGAQEGLEETAHRIAAEEHAALLGELPTWSHPTDNERLETAFAALEASDIVARQHWTCCQTCGSAEMADELAAALSAGRKVRGYTYFHQQDTETAVDGGGLMLAYGPADGGGDPASVGHEVVTALRTAGLAPEWSGHASRRILVPMVWRRPPLAGGGDRAN